ncbi:MAG: hypothetical protein KJ882_11320 [Proteobacteria bacterium]|nr:hypothetical protein [Pseudomonadota bacterium]
MKFLALKYLGAGDEGAFVAKFSDFEEIAVEMALVTSPHLRQEDYWTDNGSLALTLAKSNSGQ